MKSVRAWMFVGTVLVAASLASATTITYANRASLEAALGTYATETYTHPNGLYTIAAIDALLGPTVPVHRNTVSADFNQIFGGVYNLSNTSFRITFTNTTLGTADGVYGVGFDYGQSLPELNAFVTFGDDSTTEYSLGTADIFPLAGFFGIASDQLIKSIHISRPGNVAGSVSAAFALDNLTWGSQLVPEPSSAVLLLACMIGVLRRRPRQ